MLGERLRLYDSATLLTDHESQTVAGRLLPIDSHVCARGGGGGGGEGGGRRGSEKEGVRGAF